jgi:hypothetical protein
MTRRRSGHHCWCCRRTRPNERFSGRDHARYLCRECAHLPAEEREYRQGERDIERLLRGGFHVPRRHRAQLDRFLQHPNARVRDLAQGILDEHQRDVEERRRMRDEDEAWATGPSIGSAISGNDGTRASNDGEMTTRKHDRTDDPGDGDDCPF